jgi:hypothetical protein
LGETVLNISNGWQKCNILLKDQIRSTRTNCVPLEGTIHRYKYNKFIYVTVTMQPIGLTSVKTVYIFVAWTAAVIMKQLTGVLLMQDTEENEQKIM